MIQARGAIESADGPIAMPRHGQEREHARKAHEAVAGGRPLGHGGHRHRRVLQLHEGTEPLGLTWRYAPALCQDMAERLFGVSTYWTSSGHFHMSIPEDGVSWRMLVAFAKQAGCEAGVSKTDGELALCSAGERWAWSMEN
jgi:hypothetical protein